MPVKSHYHPFSSCCTQPLAAVEISGEVSAELGYFLEEQDNTNLYPSIAAKAEFYHSFNDENDEWVLTPFVRLDAEDEERSHVICVKAIGPITQKAGK